jgi:hypothetical protein
MTTINIGLENKPAIIPLFCVFANKFKNIILSFLNKKILFGLVKTKIQQSDLQRFLNQVFCSQMNILREDHPSYR